MPEQLDRLLTTLEKNAESNSTLATSVGLMANEVRVLGEKVEANTAEVQRLCQAQEAEDARKQQWTSMIWGVVKSPSSILLTAFALWFAATFFVVLPGSVSSSSDMPPNLPGDDHRDP